jgi:hypothetical protein
MHIHELKSFYITDSLPNNEFINNQFLNNIRECQSTSLKDKHDSITRLDWDHARNGNRYWVQQFLTHLQPKLDEIMNNLGYHNAIIQEIWFQQYNKDDVHTWHVHGHNFTGVYYVELGDDAPKTELIVPYNQESLVTPDVSVGSLLIFPSYVMHRAPTVNKDIRKTIISFNFDASTISTNKLDKLHGENNV